MKRWKTSCFTE